MAKKAVCNPEICLEKKRLQLATLPKHPSLILTTPWVICDGDNDKTTMVYALDGHKHNDDGDDDSDIQWRNFKFRAPRTGPQDLKNGPPIPHLALYGLKMGPF